MKFLPVYCYISFNFFKLFLKTIETIYYFLNIFNTIKYLLPDKNE